MKINIGVFFGGRSVEHEVSIISALQAIKAFDCAKYDIIPVYISRDGRFYTGQDVGKIEEYANIPALIKKSIEVLPAADSGRLKLLRQPPRRFGSSVEAIIDVAFPIVHGTNVEDGALQGYFRTLGVPFAGCDVFASAAGMDKFAMKALFKERDLPVLPCLRFTARDLAEGCETAADKIIRELSLPVVVKPVNLGSSVGIRLAKSRDALIDALDYAIGFASAVLAEKAVENLREINCAVLGDFDAVSASECEEPIMGDEILSYEDKYISGGKGSKGMQSLKRLLPAPISPELRERVRHYACEAFLALDCAGVARIDFLMDGKSGEIWVNEINTIPGSLAFYLWEATGKQYSELLDEMVALALKRSRSTAELSYSIDTGILKNFIGGSKGSKSGKFGSH